jgi:hypothetical protein
MEDSNSLPKTSRRRSEPAPATNGQYRADLHGIDSGRAEEPETSLGIEIRIVLNLLSRGYAFKNNLKKQHAFWCQRVRIYLAIKNGSYLDAEYNPKYDRIQFLVGYLNVVDDKTGRLLQFQALVLAAISVGVGSLWTHYETLKTIGPHSLLLFVASIFWIAYSCWFFSTLLCLWEIGRAAWGNWSFSEVPREVEPEVVKFLIGEILKRSAKFHVAVPFTALSVVLLSISLPILLWPRGGSISRPVAYVCPSAPGIGSGTGDLMYEQVQNAATVIDDNYVSPVQIVGSTYAVPDGGVLKTRTPTTPSWRSRELATWWAHGVATCSGDSRVDTVHRILYGEDRVTEEVKLRIGGDTGQSSG